MKLGKAIGVHTKYWLGFLFPNLICYYFKVKWGFYKKITIVPHGGLGDIGVIVPALKRLSTRFDRINIVCDKEYFEAVRILFKLPANIYSLNFVNQNRKEYKIDKRFISELKKTGRVIKLGMYADDPIINYPNSFFTKLGINPKHAHEKYDIGFSEFMHQGLEVFFQKFDKQYVYVNLTTSEELMAFNKEYNNSTPFVSYDNSAMALGIKDFYNVNDLNPASIHQSIINNVIICLRSSDVIISDAGLFNLIIKFNGCPDLTVVTRKHDHSHNNLLYKIKFNGTIQSCSTN
jgi:hypothetical protein